MTMRRPTITDVARHAGVSKGLVSLTLNDRPGVAAATRRRIMESARRLEWTPSAHARGLSLSSALALGLVVRREATVLSADPFFPAFIAGIESVLAEIGWTLMLSVVGDRTAEQRAYLELGARRVDGFFLTDLRVADERVEMLRLRGLPGVTLGAPLTASALPAVSQDDQAGVVAAVDHLVALGHRRVAYVSGDQRLVHGVRRLQAFQQAMQQRDLDPTAVVPGDFSPASGAAATQTLMAHRRPPTAIVFGSDPMAVAGVGVLQSLGATIPDEVSVVGFDGNELGGYLHPPLTTVSTDPLGWGREATRCLLELIEHGSAADRSLPSAQLLLRASTGVPRRADSPATGLPEVHPTH